MEFWGVEVKPGETAKCGPGSDKYLHLSQASLGETKGKGHENVAVFVKVDDQKLVLGTLSADKFTQIPYDLVFEKEFELSHTSKNASVYFCGYKSVAPDEHSEEDYPESESEEENASVGQNANGKPAVKQSQAKSGLEKANNVKEDDSASKKAKKTEPARNDKPETEDEDDEDDDDEDEDVEDSDDDEDMLGALSDSDDEDEDESSEEEDEATPKKAATGKRPAESASKVPASGAEKKAKVITPAGAQKTGGDGKKNVHIATPYPTKQAGKMPANNNKSKQQTPKSAGSVPCKSCNRTFNSENALQAHSKAKHGAS